MKRLLFATLVLGVSAFAFGDTLAITLPGDFSQAQIVESKYAGYSAIVYPGLDSAVEPIGAPNLPETFVTFTVPKGGKLLGCEFEAEWATIGEGVKIEPVQEPHLTTTVNPPFTPPDEALYAEAWPRANITPLAVQSRAGVKVLQVKVTPFRYANGKVEAAKRFTVKANFLVPMQTMAVAESEHVDYVKDDPNQPDYILIAPNMYISIWEDYVAARAADHPEMVFACVNFKDILADFPVNTTDSTLGYYARNDAERLHAYISREAKKGTHYFVLAGAFYDAHGCPANGKPTTSRKNITITTPEKQYVAGPDNALPGIYTIPRSDTHFGSSDSPVPSDVFYACCDIPEGSKYPWDAGSNTEQNSEGDGIYANEPDGWIDLMPDVVVTRIPIKCDCDWRSDVYTLTYAKTVENYLAKVRRVDTPTFDGRRKFVGVAEKVGGYPALSHNLVFRNEMEFYTGAMNLYDTAHGPTWTDSEYPTSLIMRELMGKYSPITHNEMVTDTTWSGKFANHESAINSLHSQDWELVFADGHGSQAGMANHSFMNESSQNMSALMRAFIAIGPCLTGCPDWTGNSNASGYIKACNCDSLIENPNGGAVFTVGNTRTTWGGSAMSGLPGGDGLCIGLEMLYMRGYLGETSWGEPYGAQRGPGDAWLYMLQNYTNHRNWGTGRWCWACPMAYGDPLPEPYALEDYVWVGATTGEANWNLTDSLWTTNGFPCVYDHANTASIAPTGDLTMNVGANKIAALKLVVEQPVGATFKLTGEGVARFTTDILVNRGNVTFATGGGVGHNGLEFTEEKGNVRFEGDQKFYIAKMTNVGTVTMAGSNAILDFYSDKAGAWLDFDNLAFEVPQGGHLTGNVLRSNTAGALARFLPFSVVDMDLRLETFNAFKDATAETFGTIENGRLEIGINPNIGLSEEKSFEALELPLALNNGELRVERTQTFSFGTSATSELALSVSGNSKLSTINQGAIALKGTTTVDLAADSVLTIDATLVDRDQGKLVFTGSGKVLVKNANALAGEVEIGPEITVEFAALPLPNVKKLVFDAGTKVILPKNATGTYQITPLVGAKLIDNGASFYVGNLDTPVSGVAGEDGSFFDTAKVLTWNGADGAVWSTEAQNWKQGETTRAFTDGLGVYFPEKGENLGIAVSGMRTVMFGSFANTESTYTFTKADDAASLVLNSLNSGGFLDFKLPVHVPGATHVMGGKLEINDDNAALALNTSEVRVYDGATFGTSSLANRFDKIRFIRFYFLEQSDSGKAGSRDGAGYYGVSMEEIRFSANGSEVIRGNIKSSSASVGYRNGNVGMLFNGAANTNASRGLYDTCCMLSATPEDMAARKVYITIELNTPSDMFDRYGIYASCRKAGDTLANWWTPRSWEVQVSYDGSVWTTVSTVSGQAPNTAAGGGWINNNNQNFGASLAKVPVSALGVRSGGTLLAEGAIEAAITLDDGAIIKAVEGKAMNCLEKTEVNFPENPIALDTSALTLGDEPQTIIVKSDFTFADLYRFKPLDAFASLRYLEGGKIAVVSGDNMGGPYVLAFGGEVNWDTAEWKYTQDGELVAFDGKWSEKRLEAAVDVKLDPSENTILTVDADVVCDRLMADDSKVLSGSDITFVSDGEHTIDAQTLDFSGFPGSVVYELACGKAHVIAGTYTRLMKSGTGILTVESGNTAVLSEPWGGTIEGNGTVVIDPGAGKTVDSAILACNSEATIRLASGSMTIPANASVTVAKLVCEGGATIVTVPTASGWALRNKSVEIQAGGRLEISVDNDGWTTNLDYSKIGGGGTIVYANDSGSPVTTLPALATVSTLKFAIGRGNFDVGVVSVPGITIESGATFSATSLADSSKIRYVRIYFLKTSSGNKVHLSRLRFSRNGENLNSVFARASITSSSGTTQGGSIGISDWLSSGDPSWIEVSLGIDQGSSLSMSVADMANRKLYVTIDFKNNPIDMFTDYRFTSADTNWGGLPVDWDVEVSTDGNEFVNVASVRGSSTSGNYGGTASRVAPLTVEAGGALLAKGSITAKISLAEGAIIKAVSGETLTLGHDADFIFPKTGTIKIDLSGVELERGNSIVLITGKTFTEDDLARFEPINLPKGCSLKIGEGGALTLRSPARLAPRIIVK